ncbi:MAG TPA: SPOR domain-containing protein [Acetobacteraceae bacterium]
MRPAPQATTVQLAAAGTAQNAVQAWQALQKRLPRLVRGHPPEVSSADVNGRMVWRLRTRGFATIAEADSFCARVRAAKSNCWVVGRSDEP